MALDTTDLWVFLTVQILLLVLLFFFVVLPISISFAFWFGKKVSDFQTISTKIICSCGIAFILCIHVVFLLDVAESHMGTGLPLEGFYLVIMFGFLVFFFLAFPFFCCFLCRHDDKEPLSERLCYQITYGILCFIFFGGLFFGISAVFFGFLSQSRIPIIEVEQSNYILEINYTIDDLNSLAGQSNVNSRELSLQTNYVVNEIGFFTIFSWIFFLIFGGLGFCAIPTDLIMVTPWWGSGPNYIRKKQFENIREFLKKKTEGLLMRAITFDKKKKSVNWISLKKFEREVEDVELKWEEAYYRFTGGMSHFGAAAKVGLGIFVIITFLSFWVIQIAAQTTLKGLDSGIYHSAIATLLTFADLLTVTFFKFPLIGFAILHLMIIYLYISVVVGMRKLSLYLKGFVIFPVLKPLKTSETSNFDLLAYTFGLCVCSFGIVELTTSCVESYGVGTKLNTLFRVVINHLYVNDYAFAYLPTLFVLISVVGLLVSFFKIILCRKRIEDTKEMKEFLEQEEIEPVGDEKKAES